MKMKTKTGDDRKIKVKDNTPEFTPVQCVQRSLSKDHAVTPSKGRGGV